MLGQYLFEEWVAHNEGPGQRLVIVDIGRNRFDPRARATANDADGSGRRNRHLVRKALHEAVFCGIRAGAALFGEQAGSGVSLGADMLEHPHIPNLRHHAFEGHIQRLQEGMVAHHPKPDRAFPHGAITRTRHGIGRRINEGLQHIIQEAHHIGDELRLILPLKPGLQIERG